MKYDHQHYDAIVWKGIESDPVDQKTHKYLQSEVVFFTHDLRKEENTKDNDNLKANSRRHRPRYG